MLILRLKENACDKDMRVSFLFIQLIEWVRSLVFRRTTNENR